MDRWRRSYEGISVSCSAPHAALPPIQSNDRGEAVYALPTDPSDRPGSYSISIHGGKAPVEFNLTTNASMPLEVQVLETIEAGVCLFGAVSDSADIRSLTAQEPRNLLSPMMLRTDGADKALASVFTGQQLAQVRARILAVRSAGEREFLRMRQVPDVRGARFLDDGSITVDVIEDNADEIYSVDGQLLYDRSGMQVTRVHLLRERNGDLRIEDVGKVS
jgi:hypothetical protein